MIGFHVAGADVRMLASAEPGSSAAAWVAPGLAAVLRRPVASDATATDALSATGAVFLALLCGWRDGARTARVGERGLAAALDGELCLSLGGQVAIRTPIGAIEHPGRCVARAAQSAGGLEAGNYVIVSGPPVEMAAPTAAFDLRGPAHALMTGGIGT